MVVIRRLVSDRSAEPNLNGLKDRVKCMKTTVNLCLRSIEADEERLAC